MERANISKKCGWAGQPSWPQATMPVVYTRLHFRVRVTQRMIPEAERHIADIVDSAGSAGGHRRADQQGPLRAGAPAAAAAVDGRRTWDESFDGEPRRTGNDSQWLAGSAGATIRTRAEPSSAQAGAQRRDSAGYQVDRAQVEALGRRREGTASRHQGDRRRGFRGRGAVRVHRMQYARSQPSGQAAGERTLQPFDCAHLD